MTRTGERYRVQVEPDTGYPGAFAVVIRRGDGLVVLAPVRGVKKREALKKVDLVSSVFVLAMKLMKNAMQEAVWRESFWVEVEDEQVVTDETNKEVTP